MSFKSIRQFFEKLDLRSGGPLPASCGSVKNCIKTKDDSLIRNPTFNLQMSEKGAWHRNPRLSACFIFAIHFGIAWQTSVNMPFLSDTTQICSRYQSVY